MLPKEYNNLTIVACEVCDDLVQYDTVQHEYISAPCCADCPCAESLDMLDLGEPEDPEELNFHEV